MCYGKRVPKNEGEELTRHHSANHLTDTKQRWQSITDAEVEEEDYFELNLLESVITMQNKVVDVDQRLYLTAEGRYKGGADCSEVGQTTN